jgi:hypothetical protein
MSAAFDTAREFAAHGLPVFPTHSIIDGRCCSCGDPTCGSPGKHPRTRSGVRDATIDERQLLRWDARWPDANWAFACGTEASVIDIDSKSGADPRELITEHGLDGRPTVWTGQAPAGPLEGEPGAHVYCAGGVSGEHTPVPGVGVRGGNQYVMVPGSRHVSGVAYEWANDARPWTVRLEPVPGSLGPIHRTVEPPPGETIPVGQRHNDLIETAKGLLARGVHETDLMRGALLARNEHYEKPLDRVEVVAAADWAIGTRIAGRERARASLLAAADVGDDLSGAVIDAIRRYQVVEDTDFLRVALAVAATAHLDGEPLWLQIVGSPSSGKSEAISMLRDTVDGRVGEITSAGLLSWAGGAKGHPVGLLARVGDGKRLATISDFSTILGDADRKTRAQLFSNLRVVYDGYLIREHGSAPRPLVWEGRLTLISAVTPQIDAFSSYADALGPRWLYVRVSEPSRCNRKRASDSARTYAGSKENLRADARAQALRAVTNARNRIGAVEVNDIDGDLLSDAAIVATLIRSDVPRDGYTRLVTGEVVREEPYRMVTMLVALYRGLKALGLHNIDARRITMRCAIDSAPLTRRRVLDVLRDGEIMSTKAVAQKLCADFRVAKIALEDLELLGVVEGERVGKAPKDEAEEQTDRRTREWKLAGDDGKLVARVLEGVSRKVGSIHTSPPSNARASHTSADPQSRSPRSFAERKAAARETER